ncbi:EAL domain, c-di-GMP-specific phosphodiesterase class I (or its enzymatically inactive variant) [Devosia crocina]|uniref:EAL domain, c-di-GMP-specific phosphodiesterase class I (Or its enzymatically inactive variant) n=1 Tax=Devosia crocina TaxID=429728 RepID=A0A1I7N7P4_9HYPH|nr:EAL domain-containing protein [Devosia crocina]SFV30678.1 EAL domain, c-di-GMP-specific phosphodiesterase class I (or its enzymatically inactive variant) [Devosia crocina]
MSGTSCQGCRGGEDFPVAFTMAFHPIIDLAAGKVWGYEALVRGTEGQGAGSVLSAVTEANRYVFDQACRVKAIELAGLNLPAASDARLSINFMPNAVYEPKACIRATLAAAARVQFNPNRLMFEFTENERMTDADHVANIVAEYKRMGFMTALDDFGAGYAGLGLLAKFQPDLIKIDMELLRGIDASSARQAIIASIVTMARQMDIAVLAEGVETEAELMTLRSAGISLFQGYYFARPQLERFEQPLLPLAA